jgi:mannose-1-phosphate guanylyltransferase/mannose-6-phosphate isomerase
LAKTKIFPVIMSGGSGTRLWPLSTEENPKQFHRLGAPKSMIEETALRLSGVHTLSLGGAGPGGEVEFLNPIVIAGERHRGLVSKLLAASHISPAAVVLEPEGRNTAATAVLAALIAQEIDPEAMVVLAPADHLVEDPGALIAAIQAATPFVRERIVTFGIRPTGPATGYGYIRQGKVLAEGVHEIAEFKEKPDRFTAESYLKEGGYSWNAGIFYFSPKVMLEEFAASAPDIRDGTAIALKKAARVEDEILLDAETFAKVRAEAIDRAVMEKTKRGAVAPCDPGWADVGSWSELWRLSQKDENGNAVTGSVTMVDASDNLVRGEGVHVSAVGVSGLVIVATKHSVLIIPRVRAQQVKDVIPKKLEE